MNKLISVVIVTYNNEKTLRRCLWSVKNQEGISPAEIIVVDNNSQDNTLKIVTEIGVDQILYRKENGGFAKAANEGASTASTSYLSFFNPDAEARPGAFKELIKVLEENGMVAVVGGKFLKENGKPAVSFGNFPSSGTEFFQKTRLTKVFPYGRYVSPSIFSRRLFKKTREVDWVSGGFCLMRKNIFQELGGFDENYFLYLEDVDLAKRTRNNGYEVVFCSEAEAVHHQYRSASEEAMKYEKESLEYYKSKFWKKIP